MEIKLTNTTKIQNKMPLIFIDKHTKKIDKLHSKISKSYSVLTSLKIEFKISLIMFLEDYHFR